MRIEEDKKIFHSRNFDQMLTNEKQVTNAVKQLKLPYTNIGKVELAKLK